MESPDAPDEERVWRCKACGTRQLDPTPPCERCWNTTFVAGDGASDAAGPDSPASAEATAAQVARVKTATGRSAAISGVLAATLGVLRATLSLGPTLDGFVLVGLVATAGTTAVFLAVSLLATVAYSVGESAAE